MPNPEQILSTPPDQIADFISAHASAKTLSTLVRQLNDDLLTGDATSSAMAARALSHLGFHDAV